MGGWQLPTHSLLAFVFWAVPLYFVASMWWPFFSHYLASESPGKKKFKITETNVSFG